MAVKPIPEGYHSVTPYMICSGAAKLLDFAKATFDAQETFRMPGPNGTIAHAEFRIGNSMIMVSDGGNEWPPMPCSLYIYVDDVDGAYQRALKAGATSLKEPANQFYGDRSASVRDFAGNIWGIGKHIEDVSPEEMDRRMKEMKK